MGTNYSLHFRPKLEVKHDPFEDSLDIVTRSTISTFFPVSDCLTVFIPIRISECRRVPSSHVSEISE